MCDVCRLEELKVEELNGSKPHRHNVKLYRVYQGRVAMVHLCYLHTLELFQIGERRFLGSHLPLAQSLAHRSLSNS